MITNNQFDNINYDIGIIQNVCYIVTCNKVETIFPKQLLY